MEPSIPLLNHRTTTKAPPSHTFTILKMPKRLSKHEIRSHFSKKGSIFSCDLFLNGKSGDFMGLAIIKVDDQLAAYIEGSKMHLISGVQLPWVRVNLRKHRELKEGKIIKALFVMDLPTVVDSDEVHRTFSVFGEIRELKIQKQNSIKKNRGYIRLIFEEEESLERALQAPRIIVRG